METFKKQFKKLTGQKLDISYLSIGMTVVMNFVTAAMSIQVYVSN